MIVAPNGYDLRDLVDMLTERRSRDEKERILRAIGVLRQDDRNDAAETAHILCAQRDTEVAFASHHAMDSQEGEG